MRLQFKSDLIILAFVSLLCTSPCSGQTAQQPPPPAPEQHSPAQPPDRQISGSITGTVLDESGAEVAGAQVRLTRDDSVTSEPSQNQAAVSDANGQFSFTNMPPGPFKVTISSAGFATQTYSGILHPGETFTVAGIALAVATAVTDVQVSLTQTEVAAEEIKVEEKQRVLAVIPNFYVSYVHDAAPLTSKQKFGLAWKTVIDPVTFVMVGGAAGIEQAQNHFSEYGQGAQGYAKRFGAGYADTVVGTFVGSAILPSLLKQDPRYFYKGTGSKASRFFYAVANSVVCKGDNGHWQTNYSNILGSLAAGGISNLYYPAQDRNGAGLTFENAGIGIGATSFSNLLQEFVIRKFTPKAPKQDPANP
jgi:hypothetical protein